MKRKKISFWSLPSYGRRRIKRGYAYRKENKIFGLGGWSYKKGVSQYPYK